MKAYRVEILVVDHDELGSDGITEEFENTDYANHCMSPKVMDIEGVEIGNAEEFDQHPINQRDKRREAYRELFSL